MEHTINNTIGIAMMIAVTALFIGLHSWALVQ